jgi:hypothetical protein
MSEDMKQPNDSFVELKAATNNGIVIDSKEHTPSKKNNMASASGSPEREL